MRIDVVTIFPDYLDPLRLGLIGKASESGLVDIRVHDLRSYTVDRHRTVDDTPYGGGAGMVMRAEPWGDALDALLGSIGGGGTGGGGSGAGLARDSNPPRLIVPSPAGIRFDQALAADLADEPWLAFACGRYEGIDARFVEYAAQLTRVDEVSIGDYVLGGGEAAALVMVEAVVRLLPGVLGNSASLVEESHVGGLLEYPVYTKPDSWRGLDVPVVLRSGHHGDVARWRRTAALRRTSAIRPDLIATLDPASCDAADLTALADLGWSVDADGRGFLRSDPAVRD